jgi:hypothetical protein
VRVFVQLTSALEIAHDGFLGRDGGHYPGQSPGGWMGRPVNVMFTS